MASIFLTVYWQIDRSCLSPPFIYSWITRPFSQMSTLLTSVLLLLICSQHGKNLLSSLFKMLSCPWELGRWNGRMWTFPHNLQSYFFCMSTRMNLQCRYTHMSLWLCCIKSLHLPQHSPGKKGVYQDKIGASCILAHTIPSLLLLFPSENKLQYWIQIIGFWLRKNFLLFLLFINDNKIIMDHYLCIG